MKAPTPGPWEASPTGSHVFKRLEGGYQGVIADVLHEPPGIERLATARLIAAAPDLRDALQNLLNAQRSGLLVLSEHAAKTGHDFVSQARAALKKARGG